MDYPNSHSCRVSRAPTSRSNTPERRTVPSARIVARGLAHAFGRHRDRRRSVKGWRARTSPPTPPDDGTVTQKPARPPAPKLQSATVNPSPTTGDKPQNTNQRAKHRPRQRPKPLKALPESGAKLIRHANSWNHKAVAQCGCYSGRDPVAANVPPGPLLHPRQRLTTQKKNVMDPLTLHSQMYMIQPERQTVSLDRWALPYG
jgi:hypothetical protein